MAVAAERAVRKHAAAPHQLRQAFERLAEEFEPEAEVEPAAFFEQWAASKRREVAAGTAEIYKSVCKATAAWLREQGIRRFSALTPAELVRLRDFFTLTQRPATVNVRLAILRAACNAARRQKLLSSNPVDEVPKLKTETTRRREFRPSELDLLLPTLTGEWRALTLLGLYTGQRLNDLATLRWKNLDLENKTLAFTTGKTRRLVCLPLLDTVVEVLTGLPSSDDPEAPVFPAIEGRPRSARSQDFRALLAAVGLARPVAELAEHRRETQELSFHSLRHTATSMLKAAGVSDSIAMAIVGHESTAVSRSYTHLDLDTIRQAMEKLPMR